MRCQAEDSYTHDVKYEIGHVIDDPADVCIECEQYTSHKVINVAIDSSGVIP